jgi:hypothetical protein
MECYEDHRGEIHTGDILLFSGNGGISFAIKRLTFSKWSHVAMAVRSEEWDLVLCWESTSLSNLPDVETNEILQGVQLVPLSERVKNYDGGVSVRHLEPKLTKKKARALMQFRREMSGRPYEQNYLELFRAAYDHGPWHQNVEDLSSLFCSELVAEAYQRMGLISHDAASNEFTPSDFAGPIQLLDGSMLGREHSLKEK